MSDLVLAFDFGGTKLTAAVAKVDVLASEAPGSQSWLAHQRVWSPETADAQTDLKTMIDLGRKILAGARPAAVGVSFGGPVDYESGTVRLSHHVPGWDNRPLQQYLASEFAAPVRVDNDANAAALGEYRFGAGRGYQDLLYITISTGVGGGWVLNGRPWRGYEGLAGEIGHTVVDPQGPLCLCGKRGCVERLASGPYMAQDFLEEQAEHRSAQPSTSLPSEQALDRPLGEQERVTGKTVADLASQGNSAAQKILERGAWALGVAIGNAANLVSPRLFVLGGGVTKSGERWWSAVRHAARETALPEIHFDIVPAALADDAPLWGAVALVEPLLDGPAK